MLYGFTALSWNIIKLTHENCFPVFMQGFSFNSYAAKLSYLITLIL
jgi:hypothetical protein